MLKQRVLTAIVLAVILVGTILFADSFWVRLMFAIVLFASVTELQALTTKFGQPAGVVIALLVVGLYWILADSMDSLINFYQVSIGTLLWIAITIFLIRYRFNGHWTKSLCVFQLLLGLVLLWASVHGLIFIHREFDQGGWILLYLLTLVWVADIGAYFTGRAIGRHKLAPGISPGKTWEGVLGGVVFNLVWMNVVFILSGGWGMAWWQFILVGLATSVISVIGDLFESILKREAGVKDSGKLLPGHGGMLDRIDSVIAATPVFIAGLYAVGIA